MASTNYVLMIAEMRRYPQMSYKSDIVVLSGKTNMKVTYKICLTELFHIMTRNLYLMFPFLGLDGGDRKALDAKFKPTDAPPCQFDKEDLRFVLKGKMLFPGVYILTTLSNFFPPLFLYKRC